METHEITIRVGAEAARAYEAASEEERGKMDLLLGLRLGEISGPSAPLERVMRETSVKARSRGLTEEGLDELLREG